MRRIQFYLFLTCVLVFVNSAFAQGWQKSISGIPKGFAPISLIANPYVQGGVPLLIAGDSTAGSDNDACLFHFDTLSSNWKKVDTSNAGYFNGREGVRTSFQPILYNNDGNIYLNCGHGVYKCNDFGWTWLKLAPAFSQNDIFLYKDSLWSHNLRDGSSGGDSSLYAAALKDLPSTNNSVWKKKSNVGIAPYSYDFFVDTALGAIYYDRFNGTADPVQFPYEFGSNIGKFDFHTQKFTNLNNVPKGKKIFSSFDSSEGLINSYLRSGKRSFLGYTYCIDSAKAPFNFFGVNISDDSGKTWHSFNDGLSNFDVRGIVSNKNSFDFEKLFLATYGGGVYSVDDPQNAIAWSSLNTGLPTLNVRSVSYSKPYLYVITDSGIYRRTILLTGDGRRSDSLALVDLYNKTDGQHWKNSTNWLSNKSLDQWFGVTISYNRVTTLNLDGNRLKGTLPRSIGDLGFIYYLLLGNNYAVAPADSNNLAGSLPISLGSLVNLSWLVIGSSKLTGEIPNELTNLRNIIRIDLSGNALSGNIPQNLSNWGKLQALSLGNNKLTGNLPTSIGYLYSLQYLYLRGNSLTGAIPSSIGYCRDLDDLELGRNKFTGKVPVEIGSLKKLKVLTLYNNQLSGDIPTSFASLDSLKIVYLQNNGFNSIPNFSQLKVLDTFIVSHNKLGFASIVPNLSVHGFSYSPQDSLLDRDTVRAYLNQSVSLNSGDNYAGDIFEWFKDDVSIGGATQANYSLSVKGVSSLGLYTCKITNLTIPNFTLWRNPILLRKVNDIFFTPPINGFSAQNFGDAQSAGYCYGFSLGSLMYYCGYLATPSPYLYAHQFPLNEYDNNIHNWQLHFQTNASPRFSNYFWSHQYWGRPANEVVSILRQNLASDDGSHNLVLSIWAGDPFGNAAGHAVVPYRISSGPVYDSIFIYDPNIPGSLNASIRIDRGNNTWYYPGLNWGGSKGCFPWSDVGLFPDNHNLPRRNEDYIRPVSSSSGLSEYLQYPQQVTQGDTTRGILSLGKYSRLSLLRNGIPTKGWVDTLDFSQWSQSTGVPFFSASDTLVKPEAVGFDNGLSSILDFSFSPLLNTNSKGWYYASDSSLNFVSFKSNDTAGYIHLTFDIPQHKSTILLPTLTKIDSLLSVVTKTDSKGSSIMKVFMNSMEQGDSLQTFILPSGKAFEIHNTGTTKNYTIQIGRFSIEDDSVAWLNVKIMNDQTHIYTFDSLDDFRHTEIILTIIDSTGNSKDSILRQKLGVNDLNVQNGIMCSVYPNPASNETQLRFILQNTDFVRIYLTDYIGRRVKDIFNGVSNAGLNQQTIFTEDLPSGAYQIHLISSKWSSVNDLKIVK